MLCFRNMAKCIINDKWYAERDSDINNESIRIVQAAAKLVKSEIRESLFETDQYPSNCHIEDKGCAKQWVPPLLQTFLGSIIGDEIKQIAIGHCIVQASRPRSVISPVLFGVGVTVDHMVGSKTLVQMLARLGLSITVDEVNKYKQSILQSVEEDLPASSPAAFTQWSADNVDHNIVTLDGLGTFHGMGLISMSVADSSLDTLPSGNFSEKPVKRLSRVKVADMVRGRGIPISYFTPPNVPALSLLKFKPINDVQSALCALPSMKLLLLWKIGWYFRGETDPRPNYSGYMQDISAGPHLPPGDIRMLPIIDMNPGDRSCILSTLLFISDQAKKLNIITPLVTFDQPLYIKAVEVITSLSLNVVCRMGVFHVIMSFLGSIGSVMSGSGLSEALECCYGPNAVLHMISGKAVARALRGHFLIDSALNILLLRTVLDTSVNSDSPGCITDADITDLRALYDSVTSKELDLPSLDTSECLRKLDSVLSAHTTMLSTVSRTARLWLQYMKYIDIVKTVLRAERLGDWNMHLLGISKMLNLFAATGHVQYAKCARLYLQNMLELPHTHAWLHEKLSSGHHSVRRSDRLWGGLSTDLLIEQVLMRAIKGRSGLTHGRGMSESVRLLWVHTLHKCASVHVALSRFTGFDITNDAMSHTELGKSRLSRDFTDLSKILEYFVQNCPFDVSDSRLRSISSGLVASDTDAITSDTADEVGSRIMVSMDDHAFTDVVLRKADQVRTLALLKKKIKINDNHVVIDSSILFNRLLLVMERSSEMKPCFSYELTAMPTSLFKDESLRKADKSQLAKYLTKSVDSSVANDFAGMYVMDGGCLLHRVKWRSDATYLQICMQYVDYIRNHYGANCIIVFDGYGNGPSTKDHEHYRRAKLSAPDIAIDEWKIAHRNQTAFLQNENNKKSFIDLLSIHFLKNNYTTHQACHDADTLIARTALDLASTNTPVTVVADDTDVLVLLVYHFKPEMADIFMMSEMTRVRSARISVIPVRAVCTAIGTKAVQQILVVHALSGCDTTSALYGIGKPSAFKKIVDFQDGLALSEIVGSETASIADVSQAGLRLLTMLYSGKQSDTLNHLRYVTYMHLIARSSTRPRPERLPPTERAAHFHVLRVHLQVVQWKSLMATNLDPENWGWKLKDAMYVPVATDLKAAPRDILNVISCRCRSSTGTRQQCSSTMCSCRKHGLQCVAACLHCNGEDCDNASHPTTVELCDSDDYLDGGADDDDDVAWNE